MKISAFSRIAGGLVPSKRHQTGLFTRARGKVEAYVEHKRQRRDLQSLDDHMLKDIGLTKADAERLARHPFKWL